MEKRKRMPLCVHPFLIRREGIDSKHKTANVLFYRRLVVHMLMTGVGKEGVFKEKVYPKYTENYKKMILMRT